VRLEAIHRIIEEQAATRGEHRAIAAPDGELSYRELNGRANALARQLLAAGLRRCGHVVVTQVPHPDLIVALLAALKAGASYSWARPDSSSIDGADREGLSIRSDVGGMEQSSLPLARRGELRAQPNLPVLTRGSDIACVLPGRCSPVLIPHSSVLALHPSPAVSDDLWRTEDGGIGIWLALMSGHAVTGSDSYAAAA
jgi:AMP-binding enzyme